MIVQVTNDGPEAAIAVELDGRDLLNWQGPAASLDGPGRHRIDPDTDRLGLLCYASVEIREARLEMLNGYAGHRYKAEGDDRITKD